MHAIVYVKGLRLVAPERLLAIWTNACSATTGAVEGNMHIWLVRINVSTWKNLVDESQIRQEGRLNCFGSKDGDARYIGKFLLIAFAAHLLRMGSVKLGCVDHLLPSEVLTPIFFECIETRWDGMAQMP